MSSQIHVRRRKAIQKRLKKSGMDAILITNETNVSYLTGFTGDSSSLWLEPSREIFVSDSRYTTQIAEECGLSLIHI